jgi:hypothetical protein
MLGPHYSAPESITVSGLIGSDAIPARCGLWYEIFMYPRADVDLAPELPAGAEFWIPTAEEIDADVGFSNFTDVWPITDVTADHAQNVISQDKFLSTLVASLATNDTEFEILAAAAETGYGEDEELTADQLAALIHHFPAAEVLEGLELGVAGLVYALAAAGMYPVASCRGHSDSNAWSSTPVVFFAADRSRAVVLQPLVSDSQCGFVLDPLRTELLAIVSVSIEQMLVLAQNILDNISQFRSPDQPNVDDSQPTLFDP